MGSASAYRAAKRKSRPGQRGNPEKSFGEAPKWGQKGLLCGWLGAETLPGSPSEGDLSNVSPRLTQTREHRVVPKRAGSGDNSLLPEPQVEGGEGSQDEGRGAPHGMEAEVQFQTGCHVGHCLCSFFKLPWERQGPVSSHTAPDSRATAFGYTPTVPNAAVHWNPNA